MEEKTSFLMYYTWKSYYKLLEDPELVAELLFAQFDLAEGKEVSIKNEKVQLAFDAIAPFMIRDKKKFEAIQKKNEENSKKRSEAANARWKKESDANAMQKNANAKQTSASPKHLQSNNENENDNDNGTGNENVNENDDDNADADGIYAMSCHEVPTIDEVLEVSRNHDLGVDEKEAQAFIDYYYLDRKGLINDVPIRNWRKLLAAWSKHIIVHPYSVLEPGAKGYDEYRMFPQYLQDMIDEDQMKLDGKITKATAKVIEEYKGKNNGSFKGYRQHL